ncbi:hypothetical protein C807_02844 [Lachnospiraceae bacterium 28-4]|nr:hypothetical protein C807_02844 [Lachnospiraceae bacterium 28-4]
MKLCNCRLDELQNQIKEQRVIVFGVGKYFELDMKKILPEEILRAIVYAVDNGQNHSKLQILDEAVPVYQPMKLLEEKKCVILLASSLHLYEMYQQLQDMNLGEDILCYAFPLILANSIGKTDAKIEKYMKTTENSPQIERKIHSFWFSGEKKPDAYQKCIDSWKQLCPDYKIHEWNMGNYDYTKNPFMQKAIQEKKWAFASDYARLDVIYHYGGIYLDMDMELLRPINGLLGCDAFFVFDTQNDIDLAAFAAKPGNILIRKLMNLYENVEFSVDLMSQFCQPRYIRSALKDFGVELNGSMQMIEHMVFLPKHYFMPQNSILDQSSELPEETLAIHRHNGGWLGTDYRARKMTDSEKLWDLLEE